VLLTTDITRFFVFAHPAIRAFDVNSGEELWKGELPTSARATPMTFRGPNGKQYLVISAGGHGIREAGPLGDSLAGCGKRVLNP
jgi:glucose dehydrogenase